MVAAEWEGVKMKRDFLAFLVKSRLRRFGRLGGRRPSWDGLPSLPQWGSLEESHRVLWIYGYPQGAQGGRLNHSSGTRKLQVSVQLCWLPKECRGSPPPTILERFPHLERQKHRTAFSNNPSWSKVWDGNLLHLENQRWFCCCCFLFQQGRE